MQFLDTARQGNGFSNNDLKSANVLLFKSERAQRFTWQVKVADFGAACLADSSQMRMMTTYAYAAPELLHAVIAQVTDHSTTIPYTFASDIWSIGVILTELLSANASHNMVTAADDPKYSFPEAYLMGTRVFLSTLGNHVQMAITNDERGTDSTGLALAAVMAQPCPEKRFLAADALKHPRFTSSSLLSTPTRHGSRDLNTVTVEAAGLTLARTICLLIGIQGCGLARRCLA